MALHKYRVYFSMPRGKPVLPSASRPPTAAAHSSPRYLQRKKGRRRQTHRAGGAERCRPGDGLLDPRHAKKHSTYLVISTAVSLVWWFWRVFSFMVAPWKRHGQPTASPWTRHGGTMEIPRRHHSPTMEVPRAHLGSI